MGILLAIVAATLLVSAVCSLLEAALYSTRIVTLEAAKADGPSPRAAEHLLRLKKDIATPTAAILILNTVANTAGATFAGMYAADVLGAPFLPLFSVVLTVLILLFSEILPKTYGATNSKRIWPYITWPLVAMVKGLSPVIWFTRKMTASLTSGGASAPTVTEDEIRASIRMGGRSGELSPNELQMLEGVFHFQETTCADVMVPRSEIHFFDVAAPVSSLATVWANTRHTRYPVCRGSLDDVLGMVHAKDLVGVPLSDKLALESLMRPLARVPEYASISRVLREMQASRRQIVLAIDEFGSTVGLVTLKDVLEEIVGALGDEHEHTEPEIVETSDGYLVHGNVPLTKLNRSLALDLYDPRSVTISGLLMMRLGRVLTVGDRVELKEAVAEVREVSANRATSIHLAMAHRPVAKPSDVPEDEPS